MLTDEVLERIFADKEIQKLSVSEQSNVASVISEIIEKISEENPNVQLSELLSTADSLS